MFGLFTNARGWINGNDDAQPPSVGTAPRASPSLSKSTLAIHRHLRDRSRTDVQSQHRNGEFGVDEEEEDKTDRAIAILSAAGLKMDPEKIAFIKSKRAAARRQSSTRTTPGMSTAPSSTPDNNSPSPTPSRRSTAVPTLSRSDHPKQADQGETQTLDDDSIDPELVELSSAAKHPAASSSTAAHQIDDAPSSYTASERDDAAAAEADAAAISDGTMEIQPLLPSHDGISAQQARHVERSPSSATPTEPRVQDVYKESADRINSKRALQKQHVPRRPSTRRRIYDDDEDEEEAHDEGAYVGGGADVDSSYGTETPFNRKRDLAYRDDTIETGEGDTVSTMDETDTTSYLDRPSRRSARAPHHHRQSNTVSDADESAHVIAGRRHVPSSSPTSYRHDGEDDDGTTRSGIGFLDGSVTSVAPSSYRRQVHPAHVPPPSHVEGKKGYRCCCCCSWSTIFFMFLAAVGIIFVVSALCWVLALFGLNWCPSYRTNSAAASPTVIILPSGEPIGGNNAGQPGAYYADGNYAQQRAATTYQVGDKKRWYSYLNPVNWFYTSSTSTVVENFSDVHHNLHVDTSSTSSGVVGTQPPGESLPVDTSSSSSMSGYGPGVLHANGECLCPTPIPASVPTTPPPTYVVSHAPIKQYHAQLVEAYRSMKIGPYQVQSSRAQAACFKLLTEVDAYIRMGMLRHVLSNYDTCSFSSFDEFESKVAQNLAPFDAANAHEFMMRVAQEAE